MHKNVFLRSTLRQPMKMLLLLVVTALITFAFVSRSAEYLFIKQETERLESYYQAVGTLEPVNGDNWPDSSDALAYLKTNPSVEMVQVMEYTSAVMEDVYNANTSTKNVSFRMAFSGTLQNWNLINFYFTVDTVLLGYPEYIEVGDTITLYRDNSMGITDEEALDAAYAELEQGARYLVIAYYTYSDANCHIEVIETPEGTKHDTRARMNIATDESFFVPMPLDYAVSWADLEENIREEVIKDFQIERDDLRALNILPVKDMSTLPIVQDSANNLYLADGRWLNSTDDELGNRVCVINEELATMRGLHVGDTLTLKLRDIASFMGNYEYNYDDWYEYYQGRETSMDTYEIVGIYGYRNEYADTAVRNYTYIPASAVPDSFHMTTPKTLEECGNGWVEYFDYMVREETKDPAETLPFPGDISFTLTSPEISNQFLADIRDELAAMGWTVTLLDSNWDNFQSTAVPMRQSSLLNAAIFSGLLLVTVCLLAVIYYRMRRKEIAIARALGVPVRRCAVDVSIPLVLFGLLGISAGSWLGWSYTLENAAATLSTLSEFGGGSTATLPRYWLAVMLSVAFVLLLAATAGGGVFLSSRPVLTLMQGGALTARQEHNRVAQAPVTVASSPSASPVFDTVPVRRSEIPVSSKSIGAAHIWKFVWRHVARSKLKTTLSVLLAAGFTIGLAVIQLSIAGNQEKIDWLYEHTPVEAELLLADTTQTIQGGGFIRQDTIYTLLESGYITDVYLEGDTTGAVIRYEPGMKSGQAVHGSDKNTSNKTIRAIGDEEIFLSAAGSGGAVTITYFDGWDGSIFAQEWPEDHFPVVLPKAIYEQFCDGDMVGIFCKSFYLCEVAGYYEGDVADAEGKTDPVLIPLSAYQQMSTSRLVYSKAHVTLNPSLNRELEAFTRTITEISASQRGAAALRAVIWDEELRRAVAPLENSVELMRVLYPVTLVLSLLVAVGITALFIMTSAKEAAIMRVLGTSKMKSRVMLALQTIFTSAAGLLIGLLDILAYTGQTRPDLFVNLGEVSALCAILYLLAAIIGSAVSASVVTSKNPLELLQVKE